MLELVGVAAWCFLVALAGGMVGLVLGNIRLPVLLLAASSPAAAAGANIGVSGAAALTAAIAHGRKGRIDWRLVAVMAPPSVAGALAGGYASGLLPSRVLLLVIGVALLYFGVDLLRPKRPRSDAATSEGLNLRAAVVAGGLIGLLGGLVGLILGALRMPALIRYVGESPSLAIGTNVTVGVFVGAAGLVGHAPGGIDWTLFAVGCAASVPGALIGSRLTGRLSEPQLLRAVGIVLLVAATGTLVQAAVPGAGGG
ncbi:MAG: uncharacterized protein QOJ07_106 [Thermoleophilaceae bacterium]|nr:uncharacterized protein [Thermoleophilaceae bacterium]